MAFPIKVICFISDLQTHLGLLCSELSKSRGPVKPSAQAEAGVDQAQAGTLPPTRLESLGQRGLGPSLSHGICSALGPGRFSLPCSGRSWWAPQGQLLRTNALKGQWAVDWGRHILLCPWGSLPFSPLLT